MGFFSNIFASKPSASVALSRLEVERKRLEVASRLEQQRKYLEISKKSSPGELAVGSLIPNRRN
jgi:hypothetical protein